MGIWQCAVQKAVPQSVFREDKFNKIIVLFLMDHTHEVHLNSYMISTLVILNYKII
jgi:hypothetical protein